MRRPPEVGLVALLLLGLSGCAGFPQRLSWTSPSSATVAAQTDAPTPTPRRFSLWRPPGGESPEATAPESNFAESTKTSSSILDSQTPLNVWPQKPSDGFARYFPKLSRRWDQRESVRQDMNSTSGSDSARVSANTGVTAQPSTSVARADQDVRTAADANTTAGDGDFLPGGAYSLLPLAGERAGTPPSTSAPSSAAAKPYRLPDSTADVELDIADRVTPHEDPPAPYRPSKRTTTVVVSKRPDGVMVESTESRKPIASDAGLEQTSSESGESVESSTAIAKAPNPMEMAAVDSSQPTGVATVTTTTEATNPLAVPSLSPDGAAEAQIVQTQIPAVTRTLPPAPPLGRSVSRHVQIPPAPSPTLGPGRVAPPPIADKPTVAPFQPATPTGPPRQTPAVIPPAPPSTETPPNPTPQPSPPSPPPALSREPQPSFFGWVGFRIPSEPLASSQLPPVTFPPSYRVVAPAQHVHRVSPNPQATPTPADPPTPRFGGWKPVLIPALINKIKNWKHGCGCHGCLQNATASCCHACTCCEAKTQTPAISPSPQVNWLTPGQYFGR